MSQVTNIVLCTSVCEMPGDSDAPGPNWDRVQAWLTERDFPPLAHVSPLMATTKVAEMLVGARAYNGFPHEAFAAFALSLPWECPENVVLIVQPQEGATRVHRPSHA